MTMLWTAFSLTLPPPSYQLAPSPPAPSRYELVPNRTLHTARSASAIPRSTGAPNLRSANLCFSATAPPESERRLSDQTLRSDSVPCSGPEFVRVVRLAHDPD